MSKSKKLAELLKAVDRYGLYCCNKSAHGTEIITAYDDYQDTPDDQPQPPEMPECVRVLLKTFVPVGEQLKKAVAAVEAYYAKPLKLEVGKCYEDAGGNVVDIVWYDPTFADHFVGVLRLTGDPKRYTKGGVCIGGTDFEKIIREVNR